MKNLCTSASAKSCWKSAVSTSIITLYLIKYDTSLLGESLSANEGCRFSKGSKLSESAAPQAFSLPLQEKVAYILKFRWIKGEVGVVEERSKKKTLAHLGWLIYLIKKVQQQTDNQTELPIRFISFIQLLNLFESLNTSEMWEEIQRSAVQQICTNLHIYIYLLKIQFQFLYLAFMFWYLFAKKMVLTYGTEMVFFEKRATEM